MGLSQSGTGNNKPGKRLVVVGIVLLLVIVWLASGCASVDAGVIKDKVRQAGTQEYDCDTKGTGKNKRKVCGFEQRPEVCRFHLDDGKDRAWLEVDCATEYDAYQVGENYPR
jgi:hypothetical protein